MRLIKWLKGLHYHKWELVYREKYITKYFYKCSVCGEYRYNYNTVSEKHICDKSELDSAIKFDLWVDENIKNERIKKRRLDILFKLKSESKRRCRG